MNGASVDFNRLYGDLCKKLLSTPVGEIFPGVVPEVSTSHVTSKTGTSTQSTVHPAFPSFETMAASQLQYLTNIYNPNGLLMAPVYLPTASNKQKDPGGSHSARTQKDTTPKKEREDLDKSSFPVSGTSGNMDDMENIDIQKLVDEFKMKLERYGVSQRFAARFIMEDTSQGNLSFLMEKGRNKKWEELSPRGRIPYLKMKTWLESKDQQMLTLDMLKHSQESKKNSSREAFNRRERFSLFQLNVLCRLFEENSNPPMHVRNAVAECLGIPLDRVNVWFQNQRARGFPARKVLQQSLYESHDRIDSDSDLAMDAIRRKYLNIPDNIPTIMNNTLFESKTAKSGMIQSTENLSASLLPTTPTGLDVQMKPEPVDKPFPLDLSAASNLNGSFSYVSSSSITDRPPEREMDQSQYMDSKIVHFDNLHDKLGVNTGTSVKPVLSGAAKRKRGSKILNKTESRDVKKSLESEHEAKRRKVDETPALKSDYTYLLDTSDTGPETSENSDPSVNKYDYIIKTEPSLETESFAMPDENDNGIDIRVNKEQVISMGDTAYDLSSNRHELPRNDESNKDELPTKSVALFNAMCASLTRTDGSSGDFHLKEPELD